MASSAQFLHRHFDKSKVRVILFCFCLLCLLPVLLFQRHIKAITRRSKITTPAHENTTQVNATVMRANITNKAVSVSLIVCVLSAPKNYDRRITIRRTWASTSNNKLKVVFVIAIKNLQYDSKKNLAVEEKQYNDLVLLKDLEDKYDNLTSKVLQTLQWVYENAEFDNLLKVDDDTFVRLDEFIKRLESKPLERLYWGFFNVGSPIVRQGKWAERKPYICDTYVAYALGGGYVLSYDLVKYIAENSHQLKKFANEDVSVGTWLAPLEVNLVHDDNFRMSGDCKEDQIVLHYASIDDMKRFNDSLSENGTLCGVKKEIVEKKHASKSDRTETLKRSQR